MNRVCQTIDISGDLPGKYVTTHGLRATIVKLLINQGYNDSTIMLRTGRKHVTILHKYHNLSSTEGLQKLKRIFRANNSVREITALNAFDNNAVE